MDKRNSTPVAKKIKKEHTANYIVSRFLMSKYSRKKKYKLNLAKRGFLRFIADCIDLNYKKHKRFNARISQKQIGTQNGVDRKTICRLSRELVAKNILRFDEKKQIYSFGIALLAYTKLVHPKEVGHFGIPLRSESFWYTSNVSNISNNELNENKEAKAEPVISVEEKVINAKNAEIARAELRRLTKKMKVNII